MNHTGRHLPLGLAALALLFTLGWPARAALPYAERVPAGAPLAVGIADTAGLWSKIAALPLAQAVDQYLATPAVSGSVGYQAFTLERHKMEQTTGFPITPDELLGKVFKDLLIYVTTSAVDGKAKTAVTLVAGARDGAKAARFLTALDKKNLELAAEDTSKTQTSGKVSFEKISLAGVPVSHFHVALAEDQSQDGYYALQEGKLIYANDRAAFTTALAKGAKAEAPLAQNPEFKQLSGPLPWSNADVQGWINGDALMQAGAGSPAMILGKMPGMSASNKVAFTFNLEANGLVGRLASTLDPALKTAGIKPRTLFGVSQIPPTALLAIDYGMLNAEASYQQLTRLLDLSKAAGAGVASPIAQFEQQTGISVEQELVPALGHEVTLSLNSLLVKPLAMPEIDLTLSVEVRDKAKMQLVLAKFEKYLESLASQLPPEQSAAAQPGAPAPAAPGPPKFKSVASGGGITIRSLALPSIPFSPSYALQDRYVLLSLTADGMRHALLRMTDKEPSAANSPAYNELKQIAGTGQFYSYTVVDMNKVVSNLVLPAMAIVMMRSPGAAGPQELMTIATQVLGHFGTVASAESLKNGVSMGTIKATVQ